MLGVSPSLLRRGPAAALVALVLAFAGLGLLRAADAGRAASEEVTLTADDRRPVAGESVRLRARVAGDLPAGARLVLLVNRLDRSGRLAARAARRCPAGATSCLRRVRLSDPGRVRYRAIVRRAGRALAGSRPVLVAWRAPPPTVAPGTEPPAAGDGARPMPTPGPGVAPPLPRGLPADIAGFEGWTRLNAEPIPPNSTASQGVGFDAHSSTKNVYVNIPRETARTRPFPDGTIVVKSGRRGGETALVAIMRRIAGIDPTHGDWQFVEYLADGDGGFSTGPGLRDATCWGCHGAARDTDWVFTPTDG